MIANKEVLESFPSEVYQTFTKRLKIYESRETNILKKEEAHTHDIIDAYLSLTDESGDYNTLSKKTENFKNYLKKEDQRYKSNSLTSDTQRIALEGESINHIYRGKPFSTPQCLSAIRFERI